MPISLRCCDCWSHMPHKTWTWTTLDRAENFCLCPSCIARWNEHPQPHRIRQHVIIHHHRREDAIEALVTLVQRYNYSMEQAIEVATVCRDDISQHDLWFLGEPTRQTDAPLT